MNVKISDELKADLPQTLRGKMLAATPVVMAVVATMLAGLSSSEMTRAQYDRSLAAQLQSKAGDQWGYFQAKRLRASLQRTTLDLLASTGPVRRVEAADLERAAATLPATAEPRAEFQAFIASAPGQLAVQTLASGKLPAAASPARLDASVESAESAIENLRPDREVADLVTSIRPAVLDSAFAAARDRIQAFDGAVSPLAQSIDRLDTLVASLTEEPTQPAVANLRRAVTAARLRFTALRYEAEARLNQSVASLYEIQVRRSNLSAERHHLRSQRFFYGMLAAQLAVIVSTFAMAARKRDLLWSLAAAAGLGAIAFAAYVYLAL